MSAPLRPRPAPERIMLWLAAPLVALPFLQILPIDFDRTAPLLLFLPALVLGWSLLAEAAGQVGRGPVWFRGPLLILLAGIAVSTSLSAHPAPAATTAGSWLLLGAIAAIAGSAARTDTRISPALLAGCALGAAAAILVMWALWLAAGRGAVPLYAHHRHLGLHALVGAAAGTALLVRSDTPRQRLLWFATGTVSWGGMLWSGGRTPLVALAAGLGAWWLFRPAERKRIAGATLVLTAAGLALSAAFRTQRAELGWWHAFARTAAATQPGSIDVSALTSTRSDFWRETAHRALTAPWFGHGPDAYRFLTPKLDGQQPHNFILQAWLDLGLAGAVPALLLLAIALGLGWRAVRHATSAAAAAPWLALLTSLAAAGLLDGVFYHVLTLVPAALTTGIVLFGLFPHTEAPTVRWPRITAGALTLMAVSVLLLHATVFHVLAVRPVPPNPESRAARLVRAFPSTTFGLWNWTDAWHAEDPAASLAWARWAQGEASNPVIFHVRAAQYLLARGERAAAEQEFAAAMAKAHWTTRPTIAQMQKTLFAAP